MKKYHYDVVVIGGGCAGMAAALAAQKQGSKQIAILERSSALGGVLRQCIHNGFGIHSFGQDLTGTEYASKYISQIQSSSIDVKLNTSVLEIRQNRTVLAMNSDELFEIQASSIVLSTGCRERARGALSIPGTRPAGIMTAGTAQRYMNLEGYLVGKKIVILGSGDIGLIMARQFVLEGANVLAVAELQSYSSGLTRNIVQCIEDFDIPLYYNTTVSRIVGNERLTGVWLSQVDDAKNPLPKTERFIECDALILSVGLIPENELAAQVNIDMDPVTSGPIVDNFFQTSIPGIFSCGNALHVHDLVDYVTQESATAGANASLFAQKQLDVNARAISVHAGNGVRGVVPQTIYSNYNLPIRLQFRPDKRYTDHYVTVSSGKTIISRQKHLVLTPGEMCEIEIKNKQFLCDLKVQVEE